MKITATRDISNLEELEDVKKYVAQFISATLASVNGNIEFSDNIKSSLVNVTFPASNTDVKLSHSLSRVPIGYFLVGSSTAMSLFDGSGTNTDKDLFLQSNAAGTARVMVF